MPVRRLSNKILGLVAFGALAGLSVGSMYFALGKHHWIFGNRVRAILGATEAEVRKGMGPPTHQILKGEPKGRPLDYPWEGMHYRPVPDRPVTNKVLLYKSAWSAAYIFIGPDGRVEQVDTAGT